MLSDLLEKEKTPILKRWFHHILESYSSDTARFIKQEKDPFANPVGSAIQQGINGIYEHLLQGEMSEAVKEYLDQILRIRAVQDFSPSQAVAFIFALKGIVKDVLAKKLGEKERQADLERFEALVDRLALLAFDVYVHCKEKVYELRVQEGKGHRDAAVRMLERTNRLIEKMGRTKAP